MRFKELIVETFELDAPVAEIKSGQRGGWVADIQKVLRELGYNLGKYGPNGDGVDGIVGPYTLNALTDFTKDNQIEHPEGKITSEVVFALDDTAKEKGLDKTLKHENELNYNTSQTAGSYKAVNAKEIYNYITQEKGLSKIHALGMLANIQAESSFNPGAVGDRGSSGGLFQHHKTRWSNLKAFAEKRNKDWSDWKTQIDFALSEPAGQEYAATNFKTAADSTIWFTKYFEIPANKDQQAAIRVNNLKNYDFA